MARRLNIGCGPTRPAGWTNADLPDADLRGRLPWADATFACAVCHHVLDELTLPDVRHGLEELCRVLVPGGVLRISTPDIAGGFDAWRRHDGDWFPNDGLTVDERFTSWLMWHGHRRSNFVGGQLVDLCLDAGFSAAVRAPPGGGFAIPDVRALDSRQEESIFVDAVR